MREQVPSQQPLRCTASATAPELRCQPDSDGPAEGRRPGLDLAPGNRARTVGPVQDDQRPAVLAEHSGLIPLPAFGMRIVPAMPFVQASSGGDVAQASKPRKIVL